MATARGKNWNMRSVAGGAHARAATLKSLATQALEASIEEGADYTQDNLEAAVTRTGLARARGERTPMALDTGRSGGFPGRHDTGNMVGSISWEIRNARSKIVEGVFGWWGSNFEQYFRDQDLGEGKIPAARALPQAFYRARENLRRRLDEISRNRPLS